VARDYFFVPVAPDLLSVVPDCFVLDEPALLVPLLVVVSVDDEPEPVVDPEPIVEPEPGPVVEPEPVVPVVPEVPLPVVPLPPVPIEPLAGEAGV